MVSNILDINIGGKNYRTKILLHIPMIVFQCNVLLFSFYIFTFHYVDNAEKQASGSHWLTVSRKRQFRMAIKRGMTSANAWELSVSQHLSCFSDRSMSWVWVWGGYITLGIKDLVGYILWKQNSIIVRVFCCIWMTHFRWVSYQVVVGVPTLAENAAWVLVSFGYLSIFGVKHSSSLGYHINPPKVVES